MRFSELDHSLLAPQTVPELNWNHTEQDWQKSKIRLLMVFATPAVTKMVSLSHSSIYSIIKQQFGDEVFIDFCFAPPPYQQKEFSKNYPLLYGNLSKHSWDDFDCIGLSISVMWIEQIDVYKMLLQSKFPLYHKDRMDDGKTPLLVAGGTGLDRSSGLDRIVDFYAYGYGERLFKCWLDACIKIKSVHGDIRKHKQAVIWDIRNHPGICYPSAYDERWEIQDGRVVSQLVGVAEGFPKLIKHDTDIPIEVYGKLYDQPNWWTMPGYISKNQVMGSYSCSGPSGTCNFCSESSSNGVWRERSYEDLNQALYNIKQRLMGDKCCIQSFNSHNLKRFPQLMSDIYKYYNKLSVINFRLSGLANSIRLGGEDNNYVRLIRQLGTTTLAAPVEGINQRMRDFLNKSLSFEDIKLVLTEAFRNKFLTVKVGGIRTGYERPEDIAEMVEEWREIINIRDKMGASAGIRVNLTGLISEKGTPCEMLPRVLSYRMYMATQDPGWYSYDFLPLSDLGIQIKTSNELYDVYMQQLQCDLPAELIEDAILKTSVNTDKMTKAHGQLCNEVLTSKGIDLKKQFLEYDYKQGVHRWMQASHSQAVFEKQGVSWFKKTHGICLKMVDNYVDGNAVPSCHGCTACSSVDEERAAAGLQSPEGFKSFKDWLKNREIEHQFDLMDIRDMKTASEPVFFYRLIFKVAESGRYVAKEALVRSWLSAVAQIDDRWVLGFRKIMWGGFRSIDNEGFYSHYAGYEVVHIGMTVSIENPDSLFQQANDKCPTIKLVKHHQIYEGVRNCGALKYLIELKLKTSLEEIHSKVLPAFQTGLFKIFKQVPGMIAKEVTCSLDYKLKPSKDGYILYVLMPPRFSPVLALLHGYNYNVLTLKKLISCNVIGVFSSIKASASLEDLIHDSIIDKSGFTHVSAKDSEETEDEDDAPESDGA